MITMRFHYGGSDKKMKTATVYTTGRNEWTGKDGRRRCITLRYEQQVQWCNTCKCYHNTGERDLDEWDVVPDLR